MSHLFSIIIPVYNQKDNLNDLFESIDKFNKEIDYEIIFINDGSMDNSRELIENYISNKNNIKLLSQQNMGAGLARNLGIKESTGRFILFLDSDDFFIPSILDILKEKIETSNFDVLIFNYANYENKNIIQKGYYKNDIKDDSMLALSPVPFNKLYASNFLKQNNIVFSSQRTAEDCYFNCLLSLYNPKLLIIDDVLAYKRNLPASLSHTLEISPDSIVLSMYSLYKEMNNRNFKDEYNFQSFYRYAIRYICGELRKIRQLNNKKCFEQLFLSSKSFFKSFPKKLNLKKTNLFKLNFRIYFKLIRLGHKNIYKFCDNFVIKFKINK